jgi:hypothetical protein
MLLKNKCVSSASEQKARHRVLLQTSVIFLHLSSSSDDESSILEDPGSESEDISVA